MANKQEPFDSFPISINAELIDLFEHYYLGWQWHHPKSMLFHETIQNPILAYSFLAVAYNICRGDNVRSMHYESKCMQYVANEVGRIANSVNSDRQTDICNLLWAICRLATTKVNQGQLETSLNHLNAVALVSPTMTDWDGSEYGAHLRACVAGLLMANCNRLGDVNPVLFAPSNLNDTSAVVDVKAAGFKIPPQAVVLDPAVSRLLTPEVADAMLALTAIYNTRALEEHSDDQPPRPVIHTHTGDQAYEGLRIALRLAKLGMNDNSLVSEHYDWQAAFQDCVRYCALLFPWSFGSRIIKSDEAVAQAQRHNRQYLTRELVRKVRDESAYSQSMYDLLLWMLTVLGVSADKEGKEHYASLVRDSFPGVKNRSYEEVLQLAETLPWIDVRTRALAEGFWEGTTRWTSGRGGRQRRGVHDGCGEAEDMHCVCGRQTGRKQRGCGPRSSEGDAETPRRRGSGGVLYQR